MSIPTFAEDTRSTRCDHSMLLQEKMDCTDYWWPQWVIGASGLLWLCWPSPSGSETCTTSTGSGSWSVAVPSKARQHISCSVESVEALVCLSRCLSDCSVSSCPTGSSWELSSLANWAFFFVSLPKVPALWDQQDENIISRYHDHGDCRTLEIPIKRNN